MTPEAIHVFNVTSRSTITIYSTTIRSVWQKELTTDHELRSPLGCRSQAGRREWAAYHARGRLGDLPRRKRPDWTRAAAGRASWLVHAVGVTFTVG